MGVKVVKKDSMSKFDDVRYIVIDEDSGKILDDAQGYGYKSIKKAYAAWSYKNRDKSKDKAKSKKNERIKLWMKEHTSFIKLMDGIAFEMAKGSWGEDDKFDAKFVKKMLKENNLEVDFTAGELLKVWRKS